MSNEVKWSIDPSHSEISFKVKHLMISQVKGAFTVFDASIYTAGKDFTTAEIDLSIDVESLTTGDVKRDEHLKGADFFDVQHHKQITFTSSTMGRPNAKGKHELWGELTIKGITRNTMLYVQFGGIQNDPQGKEKAGFSVFGRIRRSDWGLSWNTIIEAGAVMVVGEEVIISCEFELANADQNDLEIELQSLANVRV